ncbi:AMP-binding protein [uncultured Meiothermus sp.]|jgi:fatty-acyl-CoA synthase|uniref:class I adenylate-forming enzyme family protein n=1 Tax=uncultured Meiothermus sp. TaxID=157471 RepID=UPI002630B923|nr:AMP-binding protein [uncultured Meiothermus sp.]
MELNPNWLARLAEYHPDRPAVLWRGRWISYADLYQRAVRAAQSLAGLGIQPGSRVGVLSLNHIGYLDLYFAAPLLGFIPTLFNHRLSEAELQNLVEYTRPEVWFYGEDFSEQSRKLHRSSYPLESLQTLPAQPLQAYQARLEDTALILFTGGTTGLPRGAQIPYRQLLTNAFQTCMSWGLQPQDRYIVATPMFHAALNALCTPLLYLGGSVILQEKFDPAEYLRWVTEHQVSLLFLVPTMYQMLAQHADFASASLRGVRWAVSGGAPCPAPVRQAFKTKQVRFKQGYGLTECGVNCFTLDLDEAEQFPESVGRPMPHLWARLVDAQGAEVQQEGELWLGGPVVMSGYYRQPGDTTEALVEHEGRVWLRTGDLAQRDEAGRYYIVGRAKEMFISGGENVYPIEIERALYDHPAVLECAVAGVPDARWGEVGMAAIVLRSPASEEDFRIFLKSRLAGYKVPKHFLFPLELPKSGPGKILKTELVARFREQHA